MTRGHRGKPAFGAIEARGEAAGPQAAHLVWMVTPSRGGRTIHTTGRTITGGTTTRATTRRTTGREIRCKVDA